MSNGNPVVPEQAGTTATASKDPIGIMIEIAENKNLNETDKTTLIQYATKRFTNRRRMAYIAIFALVASLVLIFIAAFIDGFTCTTITETVGGKKIVKENVGILKSIRDSQSLFIWLEGFFASIVGAYYGVTAWRPSS